MIEFLADSSTSDLEKKETILSAVCTMFEKAKQIDIAVAFWGSGAIDALRLSSSKPTRILCDLLSGGCNPIEVEKFLTYPSVQVRHLSGLHSKIYWTPQNAIVGSANASANGLGDEGRMGTIEAAIQTDQKQICDDIEVWFNKQWELAKHDTLDSKLIEKAREAWKRRRPAPPVNNQQTFLSKLLENPSYFRRQVRICHVSEEANEKHDAAFKKQEKEIRKTFSEKEWAGADELWTTYELEETPETAEVRPDDYAIECCDNPAKIWQVREHNSWFKISEGNYGATVSRRNDIMGFKFPARERKIIVQAVKKYMKENAKTDEDMSIVVEDLPIALIADIRQRLLKAV